MSLSREDVRHIALLARLALSDEALEKYRGQLSAILDHVAALNELDTSGIEPTASVLPPMPPLRPDQAVPGLDPEELRRNAPDWEEGQFKVPPILE